MLCRPCPPQPGGHTADLKEKGMLSEAEFVAQKAKVLA